MCRTIKQTDNKRALRTTFGQFPTGVAIVTSVQPHGQPIGMTINSFSSVSMSPALVSWCIDLHAISYLHFAEAEQFSISILASGQNELAKRFATRGADKFAGIACDGNQGPVIPGACAWFICRHHSSILLGDHLMIVGEVTNYHHRPGQPLVFSQGKFQQLADTDTTTTQVAA